MIVGIAWSSRQRAGGIIRIKDLEEHAMKRRYILAWPIIVLPGGAVSWVQFIKLIAPNLTQNETAFACILGMLAIICLSMAGAFLFWLLTQYYEGNLRIIRTTHLHLEKTAMDEKNMQLRRPSMNYFVAESQNLHVMLKE